MTKLALIVVLPLALLALPGILLVDVQEGGADGCRIVVPVPLALARIATVCVPDQVRHVNCPNELRRWAPVADQFVTGLRNQSDFTLAEVTERDEHVTVRKSGRHLLVDVSSACGDEVHCRLPLRTAARILEAASHGTLDTDAAVRAACWMPSGRLVDVTSANGDRVRVTKL
ncbi:MAG: hypothetical protein ACYDIE_09635 [Candidatus Krumholzibacteriia bacterium]